MHPFIQLYKNLSHGCDQTRNESNSQILKTLESEDAWKISMDLLYEGGEAGVIGANLLKEKLKRSGERQGVRELII